MPGELPPEIITAPEEKNESKKQKKAA